jgi:hypothetical protein
VDKRAIGEAETTHSGSPRDQVALYTETLVEEIFFALGCSRDGVIRKLLGPLARLPASRLGRMAARADDEVRLSGLSGGARLILPDLSVWPTARGVENIPREGPLLIVSNHPGGFDSLAIMSFVPRKDLKVVISDVALTHALSNARRYFIYVPENDAGRSKALKESLGHLKSGGAVLIFAHGEVEPDPELGPGARETIQEWSRSIEIMLRRVPETWLQLTIVSGAVMAKFMNSPVTKIRKRAAERQKLAEVLQICRQMLFPRSVRNDIHISFAKAVGAMDLTGNDLMLAVIQMARRLLEDHLEFLKTVP